MKKQCEKCGKVFNDDYVKLEPCPAHPPFGPEGGMFAIDAKDPKFKTLPDFLNEGPNYFVPRLEEIWNNKLIVPQSRKHQRMARQWLSDMTNGRRGKKCWKAWLHLTAALILNLIKQ